MKHSSDLLATVFRANPHSMIITTLDEGRFLEVNPAFEKVTGYRRAEVIGRTVLELQLWLNASERELFVNQLNAQGRIPAMVTEFRHQDGHIHPISISSELITIDSCQCVLGVFQDLSEQQQLEKERHRADTLFRTIVEESMDAILLIDAEGHYLMANQAAAAMTGYRIDELLGMQVGDLYPDDTKPELFAQVVQGHRGSSQVLLRRKDGSTFHAEVYGTPLQIEGQLRLLSMIRDISAMVAIAKDLHDSSQRFQDFAESSSDFLWEMDAQLRFSWFSSRFSEITGLPEAVLLGKTREDTGIANVDLVAWNEHLQTLSAHRLFRGFIHPRTLADGSIVWLSIDGRPRFSNQGEFLGYRGIGRDVTERVNSESALKASERLFSSAFHVSPALSAITLRDSGVHLEVNNAWLTTLGFELDEVIGKTAAELGIWAGGERARQNIIDQLGLNNRVEDQEISLRTRDGQIREILVSIESMVIDDQTRLFWCGYDITELNRQKHRLSEAAVVFENSAEEVIVMDAQGRVVNVNPAFEEITGFRLAEVHGREPQILTSSLQSVDFYNAVWHSIKVSGRWRGELLDRRADGSTYTCWVNLNEVRDESGRINNYIAVCTDIDSIKQSQRQLEHLAHHDILTGLPNRLMFSERLHQAIAQASRHGRQLAVVFMDLDNFKHVNDSLGHDAGDRVLCHTAKLLKEEVRQEDLVARLGGDEFTILLEDISSPNQVAAVAKKLLQAFTTPFLIADQDIRSSASIGIALYPRDGDSETELLHNADAAMYRAKVQGRNTYEFYTREMTRHAVERITIESALRNALQAGQFELAYQPQVNLHSGAIIGAEALLRWNHPELGSVAPERFIPIAEETGLIIPMGTWILQTACAQARGWLDSGFGPVHIAVNIAGRQIERSKLVTTIGNALSHCGLPAGLLELEITETFIMSNAAQAIHQLTQLRDMGIRITIDDFGTGYSSLSYLQRLPVEKLKIDKSFILGLPDAPDDAALCAAILALAKSLGLKVIAEGVESAEQAAFLAAAHCDDAQGNYFYPAMSAADFRQLLAEGP